MKVGIPKEIAAGERRVAATPVTVAKIARLGLDVLVQSGAGEASESLDAQYAEVGATVVADAEALDIAWVKGVKSVGITAGASAPEELVQHLIDRLRELGKVECEKLPGITENVRFRMPAELVDSAS